MTDPRSPLHRLYWTAALGVVVAGALSCGGDSGSPSPTAHSITFTPPLPGSAEVGALLPLTVRVLDVDEEPVAGARVVFTVLAGGGHLNGDSAITNNLGIATTTWSLGTVPTLQTVQATTSGPLTSTASLATLHGPAALIKKQGGDTQTPPPSTFVAVLPRVRVVDGYDNPVPGVEVDFAVTGGGGTITGAHPLTDSLGQATLGSWKVGPAPNGVNTLSVSAGLAPAVQFLATAYPAPPGPPDSIIKTAGDSQSVRIDTSVPIRPSVRVVDSLGHPLAGVTVTFAVVTGGGFITGATPTTDSSGIAAVGSWKLGNYPTVSNILSAAVSGLPPVQFVATAIIPPVRVVIQQPTFGLVRDSSLNIAAKVTATYQLAAVVATVGDSTFPLAYDAGADLWLKTAGIIGLPADTLPVVVTATDVFDSTGADTTAIVHFIPTAIVVDAPLPFTVARPLLGVNAHCATSCTDLRLLKLNDPESSELIAMAAGDTLSGTPSLAPWEGQSITAVFEGHSSDGFGGRSRRLPLFVESSPKLATLLDAPSLVLDRDPTRVAFRSADSAAVIVSDLALTTADTVPVDAGDLILSASLFPGGVLIRSSNSGVSGVKLHRWSAGSTTDWTATYAATSGRYLVRTPTGAFGSDTVELIDLSTGSVLSTTANTGNTEQGVSAGGDIAYWTTNYEVFLQRAGDSAIRVSPSDSNRRDTYPRTDSGRVIFRQGPPCCSAGPYKILYFDGDSAIVVSDLGNVTPHPDADYQVRGLAAAYVKIAAGGILQVWVRSPDGTERQVSFFGTSSAISALGADGSVVFVNGTRRYFVPAGSSSPVDVSSSLGRTYWDGGLYYSLVGRSVFQVSP